MFEMQVKMKNEEGYYEWRSVHCSGSHEPYRYETREEALKMLRVCYPPVMLPAECETRVIEVSE